MPAWILSMTEPTVSDQLPPLYEGHGLPVDKLDPGKFEEFVFACLLQVAATWNLKIDGKPSGSGDGGFDVMGESVRIVINGMNPTSVVLGEKDHKCRDFLLEREPIRW